MLIQIGIWRVRTEASEVEYVGQGFEYWEMDMEE